MRAIVLLLWLAVVAVLIQVNSVNGQKWLIKWIRNRGGTKKAKSENNWSTKKINLKTPIAKSKRIVTEVSRELLEETDLPPQEPLQEKKTPEELLQETDPLEELLQETDSPEELLQETDSPEECLGKIDPEELPEDTDFSEELLGKTDSPGKLDSLKRLLETVCPVLQDLNCEEGVSLQVLEGVFGVADKNENLKIDPDELDLYKKIIESIEICCELNEVSE